MASRVAYALAALALLASPAQAQDSACAPTDEVRRVLRERFNERPEMAGVDGNGYLMTIYRQPGIGGSWTITVTSPGGPACIVASGKMWAELTDENDKPKGQES